MGLIIGIAACVIAALKGHKTFACVIGVWTAIALVLALSGNANIAVAPGGLFLIIAAGMKNLKKQSGTAPAAVPQDVPAAETTVPEVPSPLTEPPVAAEAEATVPQISGGIICSGCGAPLEAGVKFCQYCGTKAE